MRHQISGRKLGRTTSHRWAMFRNMATSLVEQERIETTLHKAKELRSFAEHLVTLGKENSLASRRRALDFTRSESAVSKLFSQLAPRFSARNGGYTRIMRLGYRLGDSAPMAIIEYIPGEGASATPAHKPKKEAKASLQATSSQATSSQVSKKKAVAKKASFAQKKEKATPAKATPAKASVKKAGKKRP